MSFILKILFLKKEWSKDLMRRLWFYELFDAVLSLRLVSVGEIVALFMDLSIQNLPE